MALGDFTFDDVVVDMEDSPIFPSLALATQKEVVGSASQCVMNYYYSKNKIVPYKANTLDTLKFVNIQNDNVSFVVIQSHIGTWSAGATRYFPISQQPGGSGFGLAADVNRVRGVSGSFLDIGLIINRNTAFGSVPMVFTLLKNGSDTGMVLRFTVPNATGLYVANVSLVPYSAVVSDGSIGSGDSTITILDSVMAGVSATSLIGKVVYNSSNNTQSSVIDNSVFNGSGSGSITLLDVVGSSGLNWKDGDSLSIKNSVDDGGVDYSDTDVFSLKGINNSASNHLFEALSVTLSYRIGS